MSEKFQWPKDVLEEVVSPLYAQNELGWEERGDCTLAKTYTRFPYCKGDAINWWFANYLQNTTHYKFWHPNHTTFVWDDKKRPGTTIGATHISEEILGGQTVPMRIYFYDAAEIMDTSDFKEKGISCSLCADIRLPDGSFFGHFLHFARDTSYGCELRNRFWVYHHDLDAIQALILHNQEEMGSLSEFLPGLYLRENQGRQG